MENIFEYQSINREITFSCDTFGGFKATVDVALFMTKQQLIDWMVNLLTTRLQELHLVALVEKLNQIKHLYHIHDYEMGEILLVPRQYYICNHNCNTDNDN